MSEGESSAIYDLKRIGGDVMYFQPADETALRHLFSSRFGEDTLRMSYIGPVLDPSGRIQDNPDCLILDKRGVKRRVLKCEFKYEPATKRDFAHNGQFDIAIVWRIPPSARASLEKDLAEQNGCREVIVLSDDYAVFRSLEQYRPLEPVELEDKGVKNVERVLLRIRNTGYPTAYAAYIAAAIYPLNFDLTMMLDVLANRCPEVQEMSPRGRHNTVIKLLQTRPPLISSLYHGKYMWADEINPKEACSRIDDVIRNKFRRELPDNDIITRFKRARQ